MDQNTGWSSNGYSNIQKTPLYITWSGRFEGGSFRTHASEGFLWSDTANSGTVAYSLGYGSSSVIPAYRNNRQNGFPVRCINRDFNFLLVQYGIAVNYVGANTGATLATNGYNNVQNNPLYIPRGGFFGDGIFYYQTSYGNLWSGTTNSGSNAYSLAYSSSDVAPANLIYRPGGFPVRCIAQLFSGSSDFGYLLVEQGITSSFGTAGEELNWNTDGYVKIQSSPLYTTQSGNFYGGSFQAQASYGLLWSGTIYSGTFAYLLSYYSSNVRPALYDNRYYGFPVRCIARVVDNPCFCGLA